MSYYKTHIIKATLQPLFSGATISRDKKKKTGVWRQTFQRTVKHVMGSRGKKKLRDVKTMNESKRQSYIGVGPKKCTSLTVGFQVA